MGVWAAIARSDAGVHPPLIPISIAIETPVEPPNEPRVETTPVEPPLPQQPEAAVATTEPTPSAPTTPAATSTEAITHVAPASSADPAIAAPASAAASGAVAPAADSAGAEAAVLAYPPADAKSVPPPPIGTRRLPHPFNVPQKRTQQGFCWGCGATPEEEHSSSCNVKRPRLESEDTAPADAGDEAASSPVDQQLAAADSGEGSSSVVASSCSEACASHE